MRSSWDEEPRPAPRVYIDHTMSPRRHSLALRAAAAAAALAVAAAGGGLPMCISLLAHAGAPCAMHSARNDAAMLGQAPQLTAVVAQAPVHACHPDAAGLGCVAGSACATAGPAAPAGAKVLVAVRGPSWVGVPGPASALASYLAPPLSPPPQA